MGGGLAFFIGVKVVEMKKINLLTIIMGIMAFVVWGHQAYAANVGGIIDTDTTWDLSGSPYFIIGDIFVREGATLSINPGVKVYGQNFKIRVAGTLDAKGTSESNVLFTDVNMIPELSLHGIISINFSEIQNGGIFNLGGNYGRGALILENSKILNDVNSIWIWSPTSDCYVEKNLFFNSCGINVQEDNLPNKIYIRNNVFYNQGIGYDGIYAVRSNVRDNDTVIVDHNSFLDTDRVALRLGYDGNMTAINNFWNTTDTAIIDSMIYDRNDDSNCANIIQYEPILTKPDPDTPTPVLTRAPDANYNADQVFFDDSTLEESSR